MDDSTALAFLMGLLSVVVTSGTMSKVLFGVSGIAGSAATIVEGFSMAKRGEAGRAFGAAFSPSVFGGIMGAVLFAASIPTLRPVILTLQTPDQLALCIFGLSITAFLSGSGSTLSYYLNGIGSPLPNRL